MVSNMFDKILDWFSDKFHNSLINKPSVQERINQYNYNNSRWLADNLFRDTPLEKYCRYDSKGYALDGYSKIPEIPSEYLSHLMNGTFASLKIEKFNKSSLEKIQSKFTKGWEEKIDGRQRKYGGFEKAQDSFYHSAARPFLKTISMYILVVLVIIGVGIWGIHKYQQAQQLKQYWASINSPETYKGDGFTETFPCSQVTTETLASDSDLSSNQSGCEYFGGSDHSQIDNYNVEVDHYLSDKFSISTAMSCGNPNVYTGNQNTQAYYNETRTIDGITFVICGTGTNPITASVQNGNTVYVLTALPSNEKTTYAKLNALIQGFQLN